MNSVHANTIADPQHHPGVDVDESAAEPLAAQPPVESTTRRTSWSGPLTIIGGVVAVVAVAGAIGYKYVHKPTTGKDPSALATASASNSPGVSRNFSAVAPPLAVPAAPSSTVAAASSAGAGGAVFPAADAGEARPIELRADGSAPRSGGRSGQRETNPDDGPVLVALASAGRSGSPATGTTSGGGPSAGGAMVRTAGSTTPGAPGAPDMSDLQRSLATTQQTLGTMVERLTGQMQGVQAAAGGGGAAPVGPVGVPSLPGMPGAPGIPGLAPQPQSAAGGGGLFGGQLQSSATASVMARHLGNRSLVLPKGSTFTCALKTKVISAVSGMVGCQVLRNVYSDDGRTVLIERGSHLDGEYRITQVRPGVTRIPTIWTRVRTPNGVVVDIESPAVGPLGESGLPAHVDNRWLERLGAAILVGFIDDVLQILINRSDNSEGGDTVVVGNSAAQQGRSIPEKVLESTINIPPLLTQNQGGLVGVYIARDVDFSPVYALRAVDPVNPTR
jgi:type IV secretion system protein VirB10